MGAGEWVEVFEYMAEVGAVGYAAQPWDGLKDGCTVLVSLVGQGRRTYHPGKSIVDGVVLKTFVQRAVRFEADEDGMPIIPRDM